MASQVPYESTAGPAGEVEYDVTRSRWGGWIIFASVMMILAGILNAVHGLVAIFNDEWAVFTNRGDLYLDLTTWGWIHLAVGAALAVAGLGLLTGNVLARAVAVFVAGLSIIANFLYMPAYPVWALVIIAVDVFVIYALTAHGRDLA